MRDTFDVFLANATTPFAFVDTARIVIDSLTFDGSVRFNTAENGNYYLVIAGRNIVETWTASAQALTKGATANYSFISAQSQAYGNNLVLHGSKWCLYSGDVNQDEFVDFSDLGLVDNDSYNYMSGYLVTDINGDGFIDFTDLGMVDNNSYNYIGTAKPSVLSARPHQQRQRVPLK
jgi:hypothetical protein